MQAATDKMTIAKIKNKRLNASILTPLSLTPKKKGINIILTKMMTPKAMKNSQFLLRSCFNNFSTGTTH